ncbi:uncharacterized protein AB675_1583 [Cyphellophora attinorum]|uniref:DUF7779 domain-containing protein n=1 Tax=Cyphellophora attinorum TaxID=1664694 RepID=A0A0N1NZG3_9EURO|nr:uncharacterized protein AB675_1583 [Phialophora attinorum]KPI37323.1 hypothetical protein AB675_1583 [Phialophora attinorum]
MADYKKDTAPLGLQLLSLNSETGSEGQDYTPIKTSSPGPGHTATVERSSLNITATLSDGSFTLVELQAAFEPPTRDLKLPCFSMGAQKSKPEFFGRAEVLQAMDKVLLPPSYDDLEDSAPLRSYALCGMGGIGKTELAVQYAYTRKEKFEAIFWLNADDPTILAEQFARIAQDLGLEERSDARDFAASRETVKGWLSMPRKRFPGDDQMEDVPWLLIFDNVDNLEVLPDYWPGTGRGSVLITSRDPDAKETTHLAQAGTDLQPFTVSETAQLVGRLTSYKTNENESVALHQISEIVDGLPLAIKQVAGLLRKSRMRYSEFIRLYRREGATKLIGASKTLAGPTQARGLITVWALDRLSESTRAMLQIMALLDPDGIPEDLVCQERPNVELSSYPRFEDYYDARAELLQSSLIRQADEEGGSLSLHRLVQDSIRASMQPEEMLLAYRTAFRLTSNVWPYINHRDGKLVAQMAACARFLPSALRLRDGIEALFVDYPTLELDAASANLMADAGWYVFGRGQLDEAIAFFQSALNIVQNIPMDESETRYYLIRRVHNGIGTTCAEINRPIDCLKHQTIVADLLMTRNSTFGVPVDDYPTAIAQNELGVAKAFNGDLEGAEKEFLLSIKTYQQNPNYEDVWLGWPMPNLGFIYWLQGRLTEARQILEEVLDIFRLAYGVDDVTSFRTGKILYALGNVLEDLQLYDESLSVHLRCVKQYSQSLSTMHHRFGDVCVRLTRHFIRLKDHVSARSYLDQALIAFKQPWLKNEYVRAKYWESQLLSSMDEEDLAKTAQSEAFEGRRQLKPSDTRPVDALTHKDYDDLVIFWSR